MLEVVYGVCGSAACARWRRPLRFGLIALAASAALVGHGCASPRDPAPGRSAATTAPIGVPGSGPGSHQVGQRPGAAVVRSGETGAALMVADAVADAAGPAAGGPGPGPGPGPGSAAADPIPAAGEAGSPTTGLAPADQPVAATAPGPRAAAIGANFSLIQPETFSMGSSAGERGRWTDETLHLVTLTHAFYMQITEVSQGQWKAIVGNNPAFHQDAGEVAPVEMVNWWEAVAYANALSSLEGLPKCYEMTGCSATPGKGMICAEIAVTAAGGSPYGCAGYRLPTEAEWECAYRGGSTTAFYNGPIAHTGFEPVDPNLNAIGWYWGNSGGTTRSAGLKAPNARGLYDLAGNVWEWVWDRYEAAYPGDAVADPLGPRVGDNRVARGGSFNSGALYERAAARGSARPDRGGSDLGFRLVRTGP